MKAFPNNTHDGVEWGMNLRDYFAAKVMQGFCSNHAHDILPSKVELEARIAYQIADAMLKVREE